AWLAKRPVNAMYRSLRLRYDKADARSSRPLKEAGVPARFSKSASEESEAHASNHSGSGGVVFPLRNRVGRAQRCKPFIALHQMPGCKHRPVGCRVALRLVVRQTELFHRVDERGCFTDCLQSRHIARL